MAHSPALSLPTSPQHRISAILRIKITCLVLRHFAIQESATFCR